MHMNYSQIMSAPVPLCLEKWGVMTPKLLWERRPCSIGEKTIDQSIIATF